jgi:quercetin 2,3-dioxygenase
MELIKFNITVLLNYPAYLYNAHSLNLIRKQEEHRMIKHYPYKSLGHHDMDWLDARYHFSFAGYHNRERMGFGPLRVINDDVIKAGAGFDTHPHKDMEIITFIRKGAISHRDSQGNEGRTQAGNVQVMSAGTGIYHSEFNLENEDTNLYQIWIHPHTLGVKPVWGNLEFPKTPVKTALPLLVSGRAQDKEAGVLYIHQDAAIYGGRNDAGHELKHPIHAQAYLLVSEGQIEIDGEIINKGDGVEITETELITIKANKISEIVVIDVPRTH